MGLIYNYLSQHVNKSCVDEFHSASFMGGIDQLESQSVLPECKIRVPSDKANDIQNKLT